MERWEEFRDYMELIPCGAVLLAIGERIEALKFNQLLVDLSGYPVDEYSRNMENDPFLMVLEEDRDCVYRGLVEAAKQKIPFRTSFRFVKADQTQLWVNMVATYLTDKGSDGVYRCVLVDITREMEAERLIEEKNRQLQFQLDYDALTKQYNRKAFYRYASELIEKTDVQYAIVVLDILHFKVINELYGTEAGDRVLCRLAQAIKEYIGEDGISGRLTSDHFALCIPADKLNPTELIKTLQDKVMLDEMERRLELYCGIFLVEDISVPINLMCDRANLALDTIKGSYLQHDIYYNENMKQHLLEEQQIISEMQIALDEDQMCFYLQPIYSITKGEAVTAEALVRWNHPTRGVVSPGVFVPLAEKTGFIIRIDWYVWESVCKYISRKKALGERFLPVSVNMSRMNFYVPDICRKIYGLIRRYGVEPSELRFEITESAYMQDPEQMGAIADQLHAYGFQLMMDDFGSEYSSLNMLKDIKVDFLKIDMRFLDDFEKSGRAANVISSVVRMAKWLDTAVVAEGVETREQQRFLRSIGCDMIQGYYYSRPLMLEQYQLFLEESKADHSFIPEIPESMFDVDDLFHNQEVNYLFNGMIDAAGLYEMNGDSIEVLRVNDSYYEIMGVQPDRVFRDAKDAFTHVWEEDRLKLLQACNEAKGSGEVRTVIIRRNIREDQWLWLEGRIRWIGSRGDRSLLFFVLKDITKQKQAIMELQEQNGRQRHGEIFRILMEASDIIIYDYDVLNDEMFCSIPTRDGTRSGWEIARFSQVIQQSPLIHREDLHLYLESLLQKTKEVQQQTLEHRADYYGDGYRWYKTNFHAVRDEKGVLQRVIGYGEDITETQKLKERAERDGLTGLLNRQTMEHRTNELIRRKQLSGVFYLIDVDNFKEINDGCGHTTGDSVLMCIAKILEMNFREEDLKCRLGGDELAVLVINRMDERMIQERAQAVIQGVRNLQKDLQIKHPVSVSIGIASVDEESWSFEHLYDRADKVLYEAKHAGKDRSCGG